MDKSLLLFFDIFLLIFHTIIIIFNLFGWIWKKTRMLNFVLLSLVAFSWLILGIWYGLGYCPLTHWHWEIKVAIGETNLPYSYIKYLVDYYFGTNSDPVIIDYLTAIAFILAICCSTYVNFIGKKYKIFERLKKNIVKL